MGNFKTLHVWQDSMDLAEKIYLTVRNPDFSKDFALKDQILRAAISIPSNIGEGDERGTTKESIHYFHIAKGSSAEVITQLNLAYRAGYLTDEEFSTLESNTEKIRASLKNLIKARLAKGDS